MLSLKDEESLITIHTSRDLTVDWRTAINATVQECIIQVKPGVEIACEMYGAMNLPALWKSSWKQ
eukprot:4623664-Prorocentrum_lima.AAC.1